LAAMKIESLSWGLLRSTVSPRATTRSTLPPAGIGPAECRRAQQPHLRCLNLCQRWSI
jgi:hypothetical protein